MTVDVKVWHGSGCARVTDMVNAGKRGKKCKVLRVSGCAVTYCWNESMPAHVQAGKFSVNLLGTLADLPSHCDFDQVKALVDEHLGRAKAAGVPEDLLRVYEEEIRGVDAPREKLSAGVDGVWAGGADENGVSLADLKDVNEWREISYKMSPVRAYDLAKKVWDQVKAAATCHEAARVLRDAGVRMHGWCGMD